MSIVLFDQKIGLFQMLPLQVKVEQGVMAMKGYSASLKALALQGPQDQIILHHIRDTHCKRGGGTPLQRCSCCILQPMEALE